MNSVVPSLPAPIFLVQKDAAQQRGILTIQLTMTQLAYDRLPTPRHAHRHSNLSPLATFGVLMLGQLAPDTMASAGLALPQASQL